jgi:outer membrane biosynthesis protein TonB
MPPIHSNARDTALRRLGRANRWLIAGSLALTAVFSEVAASAFPGRKSTSATPPHTSKKTSGGAGALKAPSEAPKSSTTPEVSPSQEAPPAQESSAPSESSEPSPSQEAAPPRESAPPAEESAPAQESAPAPEPAPAPVQESAPPVVSGGS